jgi:Transglycosylase-like domain
MSSSSIRPSRASAPFRLLWAGSVAALIAGFALVASAAASPLDVEAVGAQQKLIARSVSTILIDTAHQVAVETYPGPVHDPLEFDQAIDSATQYAEDIARYDAAMQAAAEHEAQLEAQRAATRYRGGPSEAGLAALRACESSGNYAAVNSSGTYRGAYQFSQETWNSVASRRHPWLVGVDPAAASPADQDAQARALYDISGRGQWPHCGRHLG